ncbi:MAG: M23 family metallopeptidase [Myxococcota bacterium]
MPSVQGDEIESMPVIPEPKAIKTSPKLDVAMCGLDACPTPLPHKKMKLHGTAVVLDKGVHGPRSFAGALARTVKKSVRRTKKIPTSYADTVRTAKPVEEIPSIRGIVASGYGHYCSITWPTGHWAMAWSTAEHSDPCGWLMELHGDEGTINRAGVFSRKGMNTAIVRCKDGAGAAYRGYGTGPLSYAFEAATQRGPAHCMMIVGPAEVPLFSADPVRGGSISHGAGFDFARPEYSVVPDDYGQHGGSPVEIMNQAGKGKDSKSNNHEGHDFGGHESEFVVAVGPGKVITQRWFDTASSNPGSTGPVQGETYIEHNLVRVPSLYTETWISAYFHMDVIIDRVGDYVDAGDTLGEVGSRGNSSGPHVHLDIMKITNPIWGEARTYAFELRQGPGGGAHNGRPVKVEPYGFTAPINIDPWAWKSPAPNGAISSNLWIKGTAPAHGNWGQ